jgi:hypothetical protein
LTRRAAVRYNWGVRRLLVALGIAVLGVSSIAATAPPVSVEPRPAAPAAQSLGWLRARILPNELVPEPDPHRRGLILSYAPGTGPPGPIHRKSFVYDGALAALAFSLAGDRVTASRILQALVRVQRSDGSFWFSYSGDVSWPDEADHEMAIIRSGATAWVGYALSFYLEGQPPPDSPRAERERDRFLATARRIADFLLTLRVADAPHARGLLRGGRGVVRLTVDPARKTVQEVYQDGPVRWISTEQNISSFFFLASLHRVSGEPRYGAAAQEIRQRLLGSLWQEDLGQFAQGFREDGRLDRTLALDCASWGALFLVAAGETDKAARALATADRLYQNRHGAVAGHRPYHDRPIYDDPRVQRVLMPAAPDARWRDLAIVWAEGSLGVALAHLRRGDVDRAREIVGEIAKMREGDGIRHATREVAYELSASPSVAGTAWHVIVEEALRAPRARGVWAR